jgi:hypothetical protein
MATASYRTPSSGRCSTAKLLSSPRWQRSGRSPSETRPNRPKGRKLGPCRTPAGSRSGPLVREPLLAAQGRAPLSGRQDARRGMRAGQCDRSSTPTDRRSGRSQPVRALASRLAEREYSAARGTASQRPSARCRVRRLQHSRRTAPWRLLLLKGDSVASVRVGARSPTVATLPGACWPRAGLSICKRFGDCRYCVAAEQLSGKGEHQRNCPKQNSADAQLPENQ